MLRTGVPIIVSQVFQDLRTITRAPVFFPSARYRLPALLHGYFVTSSYVSKSSAVFIFFVIVAMKKLFSTLIFCVLVLSSCQTRSEVSQIWTYIQERPDSALVVLNAMDASAFHGRTLAEYRLLKAMALDKNYVNVASDSLAMPAYQFFRKHGPREKEMMSLYYLALARYYLHDDADAVLFLESVTDMAEELGNKYYQGLGHIVKSYAFSRTYCISEAVKSAELGVAAFEAIPNPFQVQRAKLQLADSYLSVKEFKKAFDVFEELFSTCVTDTFTMRRSLLHGAYSMYLAHPERADSAMSLYARALKEYSAQMDIVEAAHYGEVACMAGDTKQANLILKELKKSPKYPEQRTYLEYQLYKKENKPWEALLSAEEFHNQLDSIWVSALEQSLVKSQRTYQEQQRRASEQALYLTKWIGAVSVFCFILALLVVWLYFTRKQRIISSERDHLIGSVGETARLLLESEQKNSDLEESLQVAQKRYVAAYKKQFSKISSIIENYYKTSGMRNGRDIVYKQVMEIAGTIGNDQTRMSVLERDVNAALDNAMKWYRLEFPDKGADHYRAVCLFMAGFTTPMIEVLTGITKNTLYSKKSRILEEIRNSDVEHKDSLLIAIK